MNPPSVLALAGSYSFNRSELQVAQPLTHPFLPRILLLSNAIADKSIDERSSALRPRLTLLACDDDVASWTARESSGEAL